MMKPTPEDHEQHTQATRWKVVNLPVISDERGSLGFAEMDAHVPFPIARVFYLFDVTPERPRGAHAHRACQQFLICLRGSVSVQVDDGTVRNTVVLSSPRQGLWAPALHWLDLQFLSADAVCLVLASHRYDEGDYLRDYGQFRAEVNHE